jgi:hypothetical protein
MATVIAALYAAARETIERLACDTPVDAGSRTA